jgi:hypothetical protein
MKEMALPEIKYENGIKMEDFQEGLRERSTLASQIDFDDHEYRFSHFSFPTRKNRTGPIGWTARDQSFCGPKRLDIKDAFKDEDDYSKSLLIETPLMSELMKETAHIYNHRSLVDKVRAMV